MQAGSITTQKRSRENWEGKGIPGTKRHTQFRASVNFIAGDLVESLGLGPISPVEVQCKVMNGETLRIDRSIYLPIWIQESSG